MNLSGSLSALPYGGLFEVDIFVSNYLFLVDFHMVLLTVDKTRSLVVYCKHYHREDHPGNKIVPNRLPYGWLYVLYCLQ